MLQLFPKADVLALIAAFVLLTLAVACATAATPTPVPTVTPVPTATLVPTPTPAPAPTATPTMEPQRGNWVKEEYQDPIDDSLAISIKLQASESTLGFPYDNPWLGVVCIELSGDRSGIGMFIEWGEFLGSDDLIIDWRVDSKRAASPRVWRLSGDNSTTLLFEPSTYLRDIGRAEKITARVKRDFAESITAVWHPTGFAEAYKPVAAACNLTIP